MAMHNILVCERDLSMLETIAFTINRDPDMSVFTALNQDQAKHMLAENNIDLILADLSTPDFCGIELIKNARQLKNYYIPALVLSSDGSEESINKAYNAGADDYIVKPFNPMDLIIKIKKILNTNNIDTFR